MPTPTQSSLAMLEHEETFQQEHKVDEDESSVCLLAKGSESSSTPTRKSSHPASPMSSFKVVTFDDDSNFETYHVTHWRDMTPKEISDIWIQDEEFSRIRDVSSKIVDRNETMMSISMMPHCTGTNNGGSSSSLPASSSSTLAVHDYDKKCYSNEKDSQQGKWYLRGLECWLPDIKTYIDYTIKTSIHETLDAQSMGYGSDFIAEIYSEYCRESSYTAHIIGIKDQLIANRIYKEKTVSNIHAASGSISSWKSSSSYGVFQVLKMAVGTTNKKNVKNDTKSKKKKIMEHQQQAQDGSSSSRPSSSTTSKSYFGWIRERPQRRRRDNDSKKMRIKTKSKKDAKHDENKMNVDLSFHSNTDPSYTTVECWGDECEI